MTATRTKPKTVAQVLYGAVDLLREQGWVRRRYFLPDVGLCPVEAMERSAYGTTDPVPSDADDRTAEKLHYWAVRTMQSYLNCYEHSDQR